MRRMILLLALLTSVLPQSSIALPQSIRTKNQPSITIERAIEIAKKYTVDKNIDTSNHYIDSAKLNQNPRGDRGKFWEIRWEESQFTCKGCYIVIQVYMDGSVEQVFAK